MRRLTFFPVMRGPDYDARPKNAADRVIIMNQLHVLYHHVTLSFHASAEGDTHLKVKNRR